MTKVHSRRRKRHLGNRVGTAKVPIGGRKTAPYLPISRRIAQHWRSDWGGPQRPSCVVVKSDDSGAAAAFRPMSDGVATIRPPGERDSARLIAGRDDAWCRWVGPGSNDPRPTACIVVAGEVVGWVDYDAACDWLQPGEVDIGYNVFAPHRGRGYAPRAVELLLQYLGESTTFRIATLLIDPQNAASLAVAARAGFLQGGDIGGSRYFKRAVERRDRR